MHRPLVSRPQEICGNGLLSQDAFFQTAEHLVHQEWDLSTVGEQPQVYDELAGRFLVVIVVVCDAARVEPGDEPLEGLGGSRCRV
jgi:hypothetical protein